MVKEGKSKMKNIKVKQSKEDLGFTIFNYVLLTIFLLIIFYPLYYIFICSFSSGIAIVKNQVKLWPVGFNLDGYKAIFKYNMLVTGFGNSIFYAVVGTFTNVVITILAAYPLSRKRVPGKNFIMFLFVFTMLFNGGLIPTYLLVKDLGLLYTRWAMIIPGAMSVWNMIITRTYFQTTIPDELLEASQLDGCSDIKFLMKIVLPLSKPIIAVITLFYAVGHWNAFFNALIYLNDTKMFPLQLVLRDILISNTTNSQMLTNLSMDDIVYKENLAQMLKYSVIVVSSVPMLILYPFIQKYFVQGLMVGAIKG